MKNIIKYLLLLAIVFQYTACSDKEDKVVDDFDVQFELPGSIDISPGGEHIFKVKEGKAPASSDAFVLESDGGISFVNAIVRTSSENFTIRLANEIKTGSHRVFVQRGDRKKPFGRTYINIVDDIGFTPDEGTTVYGKVSSNNGAAVANVVVSDGVEVTVTDEDGIYQLKSAKKNGYVFISIPGGYEVASEGVLPRFYAKLRGAASVQERVDFSLTKVNNQDSYKVFMLGDMHLANRTSDARQFAEFTADLTGYMNSHKGQRMYAIALGDMTWETYWKSNSYAFTEYLRDVNAQLKDLQIFHVMGNHDNAYEGITTDFAAEAQYRDKIGPTYYSFNIGKVHYVVMDNIDCSDYDGTISRNYKKIITQEQLNWLRKDLSYVDKSAPVVVAMHAQVFYPTKAGFKYDYDVINTEQLFDVLDGYKVHFVTGHTHMTFNVTPEDAIVTNNRNFHEHNSGAVCASWWWSGHLTPGVHISTDGTPGGYGIWDISGTDIKRKYKATGWSEEYQFRSYDLNTVHFSTADVPSMPSNTTIRNSFQRYVNAYPANSNNEVLINIWNWNRNWTLTVVDEDGANLPYEQVWAYDPLHIAALSIPRFNNSSITGVPSFVTNEFTHFFKVKVKDADTDLDITVKDEYGNTWSENMERPKVFSIDEYKRQ